MILIKQIKDLKILLNGYKTSGSSIGFVPTMGALHKGHLSLIHISKQYHPITVCSIFVNPTQFNNKSDFDKYPITIENDINQLESAGCEVLFLPSVDEMYPSGELVQQYELGYLEKVLEGKYRPGHFQGVCRIVDKLLSAVQPDTLYLGQKDYQQCMIIKKMMTLKNHPAQLQVCETVRETDGLAMSSRNMRLNETERKQALHIYQCLNQIKDEMKNEDIAFIKNQAMEYLSNHDFKVDYIEIADSVTLQPITNLNKNQKAVALAAAFVNEVRLIDNLLLN